MENRVINGQNVRYARKNARNDLGGCARILRASSERWRLQLNYCSAIALGNTQQLQVRWDNDPEFWRDPLVACRSDDEQVLAIRLQAKLLFCRESRSDKALRNIAVSTSKTYLPHPNDDLACSSLHDEIRFLRQ